MLLFSVVEPFVAGGSNLLDAKEKLALLQNEQQNHNSRLQLKGARLD